MKVDKQCRVTIVGLQIDQQPHRSADHGMLMYCRVLPHPGLGHGEEGDLLELVEYIFFVGQSLDTCTMLDLLGETCLLDKSWTNIGH